MDSLIEIQSEDIPARLQEDAARHLQEAFTHRLKKEGVQRFTGECFYSLRRIALVLRELPSHLPERIKERRGPPVSAKPETLEAFARQHDLDLATCPQGEHRGQTYYFLRTRIGGASMKESLVPILQDIMATFPWGKAMRFADQSLGWIRPVRGVLIQCDQECLQGKLGIGKSSTGDKNIPIVLTDVSHGHHRFSKQAVRFKDPHHYVETLRENQVMVDAQERIRLIKRALSDDLPEPSQKQIRRLSEIANMAAWPNPLVMDLPTDYAVLPFDLVEQVLWDQQRILTFLDARGQGRYLFVLDRPHSQGLSKIQQSLQRVVRARLDDALALLEEDRYRFDLGAWQDLPSQRALEERLTRPELVALAQRRIALLPILQKHLARPLNKEALACANTVIFLQTLLAEASMVKEYPDQIHRLIYELCVALRSHSSRLDGVLLALAEGAAPADLEQDEDRLRLAGLLRLNEELEALLRLSHDHGIPSGSEDPFALRARAQVVMPAFAGVALRHQFDILAMLKECSQAISIQDQSIDIYDYMMGRLGAFYPLIDKTMLNGVRAVCYSRMSDLMVILPTLFDLSRRHQEGFATLIQVAKRTSNILKQASDQGQQIQEGLLVEPGEKVLYQKILTIQQTKYDKANREQQIRDELKGVIALAPVLATFFDEVRVNVNDDAIRANRIALLRRLDSFLRRFADFSQINRSSGSKPGIDSP